VPTDEQTTASQSTNHEGATGTVSRAIASGLGLIAAVFFATSALVGVFTWAHPIPYWDMWDGLLSFWFQLQDGNTAIWWELSNEHHLILLKVLFWIDLAIFSGSSTFLLAVNTALLAVVVALLVVLLRERLICSAGTIKPLTGFLLLASVLTVIVTAWMQGEDLTIGYHAQWLMITAVPIAAFLFLGLTRKAQDIGNAGRSRKWFIAAVLMTLLAPWAAASGLVAPFIAAALALAIGLGIARAAVLAGIGIASAVVYLAGHPLLQSSGSTTGNLLTAPLEILQFWLLYLGGPWSRATDNQWLGGVAGVVFILAVVYLMVREFRSRTRSTFGLVVVAFPVFMLAMALVTAVGRIDYGLEQVNALRYLTPMLSAWACLLILAAPPLQRWFAAGMPLAFVSVLLIPVILLPEQVSALTPPRSTLHERDTATLAVALGAPDSSVIIPVYPISTERPIELGARARAEGVGVFAREPYASLPATMDMPVLGKESAICAGWLDSRTPLEGSSWDRVDGWVVVDGYPISDGVLTLTDRNAQTLGWVAVGKPREDVLVEFPDASGLNGYSGYLQSGAASGDIFVAGDSFRCSEPLISAVP